MNGRPIAKLSQSITQDMHDKKCTELKQRQLEINPHLEPHLKADDSFRITSTVFTLASQAYELLKSSKMEQKRQLINLMFSNLQLRGKKLEYTMHKPFSLMANTHTYQEWLSMVDKFRTECYEVVIKLKVRNLALNSVRFSSSL